MRPGTVLAIVALMLAAGALGYVIGQGQADTPPPRRALEPAATCLRSPLPVVVDLGDDKHRDLIDHERAAIAGADSREVSPRAPAHAARVLHVDRGDADAHRTQDLRGIPTWFSLPRDGDGSQTRLKLDPGHPDDPHDRDEWPPAASAEAGLKEDGTSASVEYVLSSENRSGGSALGSQLSDYCDSQAYIVEAGAP